MKTFFFGLFLLLFVGFILFVAGMVIVSLWHHLRTTLPLHRLSVDETADLLDDMDWMRRRIEWPEHVHEAGGKVEVWRERLEEGRRKRWWE